MSKKLSEMTLEELWKLFPIQLTAPKREWKKQYTEMAAILEERLSAYHITRISHIGSTAASLRAKPIIDILLEIAPEENISLIAESIKKSGFIQMSSSEKRISFNLGYTENGFAEKVYHLHLRYAGDNDELYFRDYLHNHPDIAQEYERLKLNLCRKYKYNRDAYTQAKTTFIQKYTAAAKKQYAGRY